jgi:RNA polymerase sigma-70 factor (ECF subfamily)
MPESASEFEALMVRARGGCPEAAREVFERYSHSVLIVVRRYLHEALRRQYDSVDFMQSVWAAFFQVSPESYTFASPNELVRFLSRVAANKVIDATRRGLVGQKRDAARELSLDDAHNRRQDLAARLSGRLPTPSQEAIAEERWKNMLEGQPAHYRRALEMLRQGHSHREIAEVLGVHPKLLQRVLQKLRDRMDKP